MIPEKPDRTSQTDKELEREILRDRKFSLSEAIGRLAGPGTMKGASPVSRKQQAEAEIETFLREHLTGADCLERVLARVISTSPLLLNNYDQPLVVLAALVQRILGSDYLVKELVRQADVEWATTYGERPYFQTEGQPPHPDDPYTFESVTSSLRQLISVLEERQPTQ